MTKDKNRSAVVTGASSGIGHAIADALLRDGWRVFGSVRKESDATSLKAEFGDNFTPLVFDVTDDDAIKEAAAKVKTELDGETLGALVNNAGIAVAGPVRYLPLEDLKRQIDVNVYGPLRTTQAFLPMLGADKSFRGAPGRIINMSSVAGGIASPFMSPYSMSKHALEAFSDSLRREMLMHGIDVIVIGPGAISTPIWAKADDIDIDQYSGTEYAGILEQMKKSMREYGESGLPPEAVGALVVKILKSEKPKARYAILKNKFLLWTLPRLLPKRLIDKALAKRFGIISS